jgi:energy-coupling factor transporter ATP-binding protein EcfA2
MEGVTVLGVTLDGPPPLGVVNLRFEPGVDVFYGVNGAGKSTILRATHRALSASEGAGRALAHIRVDHVGPLNEGYSPDRDGGFVLSLAMAIVTELRAEFGATKLVELGDPAAGDGLARLVEAVLAAGAPELGGANAEAVRAEIAGSGFFTLEARGGWWRVWIGCDRTEGAGLSISHSRARINEIGQLINAGTLSHEDGMEEVASLGPWMLMERESPCSLPDTPGWVPLSVAPCCDVISLGHELAMIPESSLDLACRHTLDYLDRFEHLVDMVGNVMMVDAEVQEAIDGLSELATDWLSTLLLDAPPLGCRLRPPRQWFTGEGIEWHAWDRQSSKEVPIRALSEAQRRFAVAAIEGALRAKNPRADIVIVDEPELGLHPDAQRYLAAGLNSGASATGCTVLAATHSAALLSHPASRLHYVDRSSGLAEVRPLPSLLREDPPPGLAPPDLLQFVRSYLIVETADEAAIIATVIGDQLDEIGAKVVAVGSIRPVQPVPDSELIFDFTSASVVVVVDCARSEELRAAWKAVRESAGCDSDEALRKIQELTESGSSKERLLGEFCRRAVQRGHERRLDLFGFPRTDIIEYLPVCEFAPLADWNAVEQRWPGDIPFREWVREEYCAQINPEHLAEIAGRLDSIPDDFLELVALCAKNTGL